jgi:phosphoribosylanthranilate isomerase
MTIAVKICGITETATLDAAIAAGADYIGLVFFEKSPRHLDIAKAAALAAHARSRTRIVALTVDADDAAIDRIIREVVPDMLQLHGDEPPARVAAIGMMTQLPVMKAIGVSTRADAARAHDYAAAEMILFDAKPPPDAVLPGGNGAAFDWSLLSGLALGTPWMLSGGLTPETVGDAIRQSGARAVDVSSGVEKSRGVKDAALIQRFIAAAKAAMDSA